MPSSAWGAGGVTGMIIDKVLISRLLCVAVVAAIMLPLGGQVFPYVSDILSGPQFHAIEAVVGATVGFGISTVVG